MRAPVETCCLVLLAVACGGAPASSAASGDAAAPPETATTPLRFDPTSITPGDLALGDSIFHGLKAAASCQACHGPKANTGEMAPNLTDAEWLHSDGSLEGIYTTVKSGVMSPKQYSSVMMPNGGAPLTPEQTRAVAAYVYSLSHKVGQ